MFFIGRVIRGEQFGEKIGFKTANIEAPNNLDSGIYCGFTFFKEKKYVSAFYKSKKRAKIIEAHLLNFNADLYDKKLKIQILRKIREDKDFENIEELKEQIKKDINLTKIICSQE